MDTGKILEAYDRDERIAALHHLIFDRKSKRVFLSGLKGASTAFVIAALVRKQRGPFHLVICNNKDDAAYRYNDLQNLLPSEAIRFLPDSFKHPGRFGEISRINQQSRTEVAGFLAGKSPGIIVTYPEALIEKIPLPGAIGSKMLHIRKGEKLDIDFLNEIFFEFLFERVDFVYEPGQFSVRGGIIDIFSFGSDYPYRIELFDDEIESIRRFNPETQLSVGNLEEISIVPDLNKTTTAAEKVSLFEALPGDTVVWIDDIGFVQELSLELLQKSGSLLTVFAGDDENEEESFPVSFVENPILVNDSLPYTIVTTGRAGPLEDNTASQVVFQTSPQPVFNKNFELLINDLKDKTASGYRNYILSDNEKQLQRFAHIFEDLNADVQYQPVHQALSAGFIDHDLKVAIYTDHQIFERYHKYRLKSGFSKSAALMRKTLQELKPGDYVVHIDHGIGVYSGLETIDVNGHKQEVVRIVYQDNDLLYVGINSLHKISRFTGQDGKTPRINKLGTGAWDALKRKTKKKIKDIAKDLITLYAKRKAQPGFAFSPDSYLQDELEASFIYEDTPDQIKATEDFKKDMESPHPMDRLICGDVGFGKTEIAIRAAFKAVCDNKQVAVLVPTTILALQHYQTFSERLKDFPCTIDYLNRFKTAKQKRETLEKLASGEIDIIIGTHALLGKQVKFKDLGLLIIDEEQKFGVAAKEKLRQLKVNVDTLTLTATPIPRTLQFSLMGARDMSIINTPPPNRQPIHTEIVTFDQDRIREAIEYEIFRGGQVFFIHNRVKDIMDIAALVKRLCPDFEVGVAHGQMEGKKLESVMMQFINRQFDILVSTNIVESGLDIPNANTIIIHNAHQFGLSDLHQLRGRVGRSNKKAFCYLIAPPLHSLPSDSRKRLKTLEEFSELGSGFNIAMRDLDIRGAGNLLGAEQSGFIAEIGYEMYHKILDEAIQELKEEEFRDLFKEELEKKAKEFVRDCQIETDIEMRIPPEYINSVNERLYIYTQLDNLEEDENRMLEFQAQLRDRFGLLPQPVISLCNAIRLRWRARKLGFEKVILKNNSLRCYFLDNPDSPYYQSETFGRILQYIQINRHCQLKQSGRHLILTIPGVTDMETAVDIFDRIPL